jgi:hypothetical protein
MTSLQATWIREFAWLPFMRRQLWCGPDGYTYDAALSASVCECMAGVCGMCSTGRHEFCDRWAIRPRPEWWIKNRPLDYIPPTAVWYADRACRSLCPCPCPRQMTQGEAAWVREHAWTNGMRKQHRDAPLAAVSCACQYEATHWCSPDTNQHERCHRATPQFTWETLICDRTGIHPLHLPAPFTHPTPSPTGARRGTLAVVLLADRVCRWLCPCPCHVAPAPQPEQLDLFAEAAA